jgi:hypothetical protein
VNPAAWPIFERNIPRDSKIVPVIVESRDDMEHIRRCLSCFLLFSFKRYVSHSGPDRLASFMPRVVRSQFFVMLAIPNSSDRQWQEFDLLGVPSDPDLDFPSGFQTSERVLFSVGFPRSRSLDCDVPFALPVVFPLAWGNDPFL